MSALVREHQLFDAQKRRFIIFCHSSYTIGPILRVLALVECLAPDSRIEILVGHWKLRASIGRLLARFKNVEVKHIGPIASPRCRSLRSLLLEFRTLLKLHRSYARRRHTNVVFASRFCVQHEYFILRRLEASEGNHVAYLDVYGADKRHERPVRRPSFRERLATRAQQSIFGPDLDLYGMGKLRYMGLSREYLQRFPRMSVDTLAAVPPAAVDLEKVAHRVVYFDQDLHGSHGTVVDLVRYEESLDAIFAVLSQAGLRKADIGIKFHPSSARFEKLLDFGEEVREAIPAEFLDLSECDFIMTPFSTVLSTLAGQVPRLSTVDLVPWTDTSTHEIQKEHNVTKHGVEYVPRSLAELSVAVARLLAGTETKGKGVREGQVGRRQEDSS